MIFQIESFSTIRMSVSDVTQSKLWYKNLFDLDPIEDLENFVSFKIGATNFDIVLEDAKSPISVGGSVGYWLIDDLNTLLDRVRHLGGKIYRGPLDVPEIQRSIIQIQDPYGNIVGFEAPLK